MCGRYALTLTGQEASNVLDSEGVPVVNVIVSHERQSTNIAPQSYGLVYRVDGSGKHTLQYLRWGLVPSFMKTAPNFPTFNARADSVEQGKTAWRSVKTRRAIVLMEGYYEWRHDVKARLPYYFHRTDGKLLCALAIWDTNEHVGDGHSTFAIVTTSAEKSLAHIHPRMPAFVEFDHISTWVDGEWPSVLSLIQPMPNIEAYQVSTEVNKVGNQGPALNRPLRNWFQVPLRKTLADTKSEEDSRPDAGNEIKSTKPIDVKSSPAGRIVKRAKKNSHNSQMTIDKLFTPSHSRKRAQ